MTLFRITALVALALTTIVRAQASDREDWSVHAQATYVWQWKPSFGAAYSGPKSLRPEHERSYTFSTTGYLGLRPWSGGELYFNPEAVQGAPLSGVAGLGGLTNGEIQKVAGPQLKAYRARLFLRQTWGFGGGEETVESEANQLAGAVDRNRLVLTAGNVAATDLFGTGEYVGDARTQFLNWSFLTFGAYDYAADLRGYTWGAALEYYRDDWTVRGGRFMQPVRSNGMKLDTRIFRAFGDQVEVEHRHTIDGRAGKLQLLGYRNVARMGSYSDALALAQADGSTPDIAAVRRRQSKTGVGLAIEQTLRDDVGVFARASLHDGKTETYAFTEIDRSLAAGISMKGIRWRRAEDTLGLAVVRNGISKSHRDYLAAGGATFFLGDGGLTYRPETIFETFYSIGVAKHAWLSLDWQYIRNPGYNADRGPVRVSSLRLHASF